MADTGLERLAELRLGLRVSVQVDPGRIESGLQREVQLTPGRDVASQALRGEDAVHRTARKRLGCEQHVVVLVARADRLEEGTRPRTQVVLGDDIRRGPEFSGQLHRVATADLQPPAFVDPGAERMHVGERGDGSRHRLAIMP